MTLLDFGLELDNNVYQDATDTPISEGIEYAVNTMPENSAVFVVDIAGNAIFLTRQTGKPQLADTYINASATTDYQVIGGWIKEFIKNHTYSQYGIIAETSNGYQVIKNGKDDKVMKLVTAKEFAEAIKDKAVNISIGSPVIDGYQVTFEEVTPTIKLVDDGYRFIVDVPRAHFEIMDGKITTDGNGFWIELENIATLIRVDISGERKVIDDFG